MICSSLGSVTTVASVTTLISSTPVYEDRNGTTEDLFPAFVSGKNPGPIIQVLAWESILTENMDDFVEMLCAGDVVL